MFNVSNLVLSSIIFVSLEMDTFEIKKCGKVFEQAKIRLFDYTVRSFDHNCHMHINKT